MDSIDLIREFLQDRLGIGEDKIVPETPLAALGVDSLLVLEMMFAFEDHFGIKLSKNLKTPQTIGQMVSLMDRLRREQLR